MKEIAFITNNLNVGGSQKVIVNLANAACKRGYKVLIISLTSDLFLKSCLDTCVEIEVCSPKLKSSGFINRFFIFLSLIKILRKKKISLLHSHLWQIDIIYLVLTKLILKVRVIHTIHSPGSSYLKLKLFDHINNFIENIFINKFKDVQVTVVSPEIKLVIEDVLSFSKHSIFIPNGVEISDIDKKKVTAGFTFIYPARFQESKGHKYLLEAIKILVNRGYNIELQLLGIGLFENLYEIILDLNLINNVQIIGAVTDVNSYILNANFGVFPSYYEGHSISLCEMMAAGLPIVASNIQSNRLITKEGNGALLFEVGSVMSLANAMETLILDSDLALRLGNQAKLIVEEYYSIDKMFNRYDDIYNN